MNGGGAGGRILCFLGGKLVWRFNDGGCNCFPRSAVKVCMKEGY